MPPMISSFLEAVLLLLSIMDELVMIGSITEFFLSFSFPIDGNSDTFGSALEFLILISRIKCLPLAHAVFRPL